jgi:hypothetical protein
MFLTVNKGVKQTLKFRNTMFTVLTHCEINYILWADLALFVHNKKPPFL